MPSLRPWRLLPLVDLRPWDWGPGAGLCRTRTSSLRGMDLGGETGAQGWCPTTVCDNVTWSPIPAGGETGRPVSTGWGDPRACEGWPGPGQEEHGRMAAQVLPARVNSGNVRAAGGETGLGQARFPSRC